MNPFWQWDPWWASCYTQLWWDGSPHQPWMPLGNHNYWIKEYIHHHRWHERSVHCATLHMCNWNCHSTFYCCEQKDSWSWFHKGWGSRHPLWFVRKWMDDARAFSSVVPQSLLKVRQSKTANNFNNGWPFFSLLSSHHQSSSWTQSHLACSLYHQIPPTSHSRYRQSMFCSSEECLEGNSPHFPHQQPRKKSDAHAMTSVLYLLRHGSSPWLWLTSLLVSALQGFSPSNGCR